MVERFESPNDNLRMMPDSIGDFVRYSDYAALKAENERLERERDKWEQRACTGDDVLARTRDKLAAAERALAERAGGVKVDRTLSVFDWAYDDQQTGQQVYARTPENAERLLASGIVLTPVYTLTTELAAPEGRREAVAYGEDIDGKIVSVRLDKSRHCTVPLYTHPPASEPTEVEGLEQMPETVDRRLFYEDEPDGYLESDKDWAAKNWEAVRWLADNHAAIRAALLAAKRVRT